MNCTLFAALLYVQNDLEIRSSRKNILVSDFEDRKVIMLGKHF